MGQAQVLEHIAATFLGPDFRFHALYYTRANCKTRKSDIFPLESNLWSGRTVGAGKGGIFGETERSLRFADVFSVMEKLVKEAKKMVGAT